MMRTIVALNSAVHNEREYDPETYQRSVAKAVAAIARLATQELWPSFGRLRLA